MFRNIFVLSVTCLFTSSLFSQEAIDVENVKISSDFDYKEIRRYFARVLEKEEDWHEVEDRNARVLLYWQSLVNDAVEANDDQFSPVRAGQRYCWKLCSRELKKGGVSC